MHRFRIQLNQWVIVLLCASFVLIALVGLQLTARERNKFSWESSRDYVRMQVLGCTQSDRKGWRGTCFTELSKRLLSQFTLEEILNDLSQIDDNEGIKQQCHALTHNLGQDAYAQTKSVSKTFAQCSSHVACSDGCYHGVVEEYIAEAGFGFSQKTIAKMCADAHLASPIEYVACQHGLGHAFMLLYGNEIQPSLKGCDVLTGAKERSYCYDGVFMENVLDEGNETHPSKYIKQDDFIYPCTEFPTKYQNECYWAVGLRVVREFNNNFTEAVNFCGTLDTLSHRANCYGALGAQATVVFVDPASIVNVCNLVPKGTERDSCFESAVRFRSFGTGADTTQVKAICDGAEMGDQATCFEAVRSELELWHNYAK